MRFHREHHPFAPTLPRLALPGPEVPIFLSRANADVITTGVTQFDIAKEALNARRWVRGTQLQLVPVTFSRRKTLMSTRRA